MASADRTFLKVFEADSMRHGGAAESADPVPPVPQVILAAEILRESAAGNRDIQGLLPEPSMAPEQRKDERQDNTQKNRRDYGEVKDRVLAAVDKITRQPAQPG